MLRLAGAFAAATLAIASVAATSAGDPTQVAVSPASAEVVVGEEFALEFTLAGVPETPGVGGYVLALQWDPRHLELVSLADAGFVTGGDNIVICGEPVVEAETAQAVLFCATIPLFGAPGVSTAGPAVFARSSFRALAAGRTSIELEGTYLEGPAEEELPAALTGATVTIAEPGQPETPPEGDSTSGPTPTLVEVKPPAAGSGFASENAGSGDGRAWLLAAMALALSGAVASGLTLHRTRAMLRDDERQARTRGR